MMFRRRRPATPDGSAVITAPLAAGFVPALRRALSRTPLHVVIIGIAVLWLVPSLALLVSSFREASLITESGWWTAIKSPLDFTLENYSDVLSQQRMAQSFVNSVVITIPTTIIIILIAAFTAHAFAWMRFPGRNILFLLVVALLVVPLQMTLIPVLQLYTSLEVDIDFPALVLPITEEDIEIGGGRLFGTGSFPGIWLAHSADGLPFAVFLLRNFFGALPRELMESAYLDGASDLRVFFRLVLPLSVPALAALAIFQFLWVWNDLLVALIILQEGDLAPMTLTISNLTTSLGVGFELLTAAAFISMALPLVVFFALQRYFVQGILAGSVKG